MSMAGADFILVPPREYFPSETMAPKSFATKKRLPRWCHQRCHVCFARSTVKQSIDDYAARLSRVLDTPLPDSFNDKITTPLPKLADSATLKHAIEGVNINLREFYALQDCELGTVVAERNTSLGKSQLPSQRLVYESKLLNVLKSCEAALTKENESNQRNATLAATIASWREQKTQDYSKTWANLVQGSQELRLALNTPERLFSVENNKDALSSVNALYYINSLSNKGLLLSDMYSSNTASSDTETEASNENNSESIIESSELEHYTLSQVTRYTLAYTTNLNAKPLIAYEYA